MEKDACYLALPLWCVSIAVVGGKLRFLSGRPRDLWHSIFRHGFCFLGMNYYCNMYMYNCDFFVCFRTYLFVRALLAKILKLRRYRKAVRNLWSRFELDPSTVARVAGAQSFFFPGMDKTISRGFGEIMTQRQQQQ